MNELDRANEARRRSWYGTGYEDAGISIGEPYTHANTLREGANVSHTEHPLVGLAIIVLADALVIGIAYAICVAWQHWGPK